MILAISRFKDGEDYTAGKFELTRDDESLLVGYTLEPAGPDTTEANKDKRIPEGEYSVSWEFSPRFNGLYPVLFNDKVAKSRRILIHSGNYGKNTEGCILVGRTYDNGAVYKSRDCLRELFDIIDYKDFKIRIINEDQ